MGFGENASIMAAHAVLVVVLAILSGRVMLAFRHQEVLARAERLGFSATVAVACLAFSIECAYYILARALKDTGLDLWAAHPAPALLRLMVASGFFAMTLPLLGAMRGEGSGWRRRAGIEAASLLALWAGLAWWLR